MAADRYGRLSAYSLSGDGLDRAEAVGVEFGNSGEVYRIPYPAGRSVPAVIGIYADQVAITDISMGDVFHNWLIEAANDPTMSRDITVRDTRNGNEWTLINAIPVGDAIRFARNESGYVANRITLAAERVSRPGEPQIDEQPITAVVGDVVIDIPGKERGRIENILSGSKTPGIVGDNSQWIMSSGIRLAFEFHVSKQSAGDGPVVTPDSIIERLEAYCRKSTGGASAEIVTFSYKRHSFPAVVASLEWEEIHSDKSGNTVIARGSIEIQERHVPGTERTTREQRGLGIYEVTGSYETFHSIAFSLWGDEALWIALSDYNPMPDLYGPCLPAGAVLSVPPWDFVQSYLDAGGGGSGGIPWLN